MSSRGVDRRREGLGTPVVAAVAPGDEWAGEALGVGCGGAGQFGDAQQGEELVVGEAGADSADHRASFRAAERRRRQSGQTLPEREMAVHPIEPLGIGRIVPHDPVEVVRVEA